MKGNPAVSKQLTASQATPQRTPHVAAVRKLEPESGRPLRVWSLLLAPNLERK